MRWIKFKNFKTDLVPVFQRCKIRVFIFRWDDYWEIGCVKG